MFAFARPILLLALGTLMMACTDQGGRDSSDQSADSSDTEETRMPVELVRVTRKDVYAAYQGTASLEAEENTEIVAKTGGVLLEILVEEGDKVDANQVVARLDREQLSLERDRSVATLNRLDREYQRSSELYAKNLISSDAHEKARAELESQKASHRLTELSLSYAEVRTPIAGIITERLVKRGNLVNQYETLFQVSDFSTLNAVLFVPERELETLRTGQNAVVIADAYPQRQFIGVVDRVSPSIDASTGTFRATIALDNADFELKPGMFSRVSIIYDRHPDAVAVPFDAVVQEDEQGFIFKVEEGRAKRVSISTGFETDGFIEVLDGLTDEDLVVINGQMSLNSGVLLDVLNATEFSGDVNLLTDPTEESDDELSSLAESTVSDP